MVNRGEDRLVYIRQSPSGGNIVVEFGNARYQRVMDRYTSGEPVASRELVHVWRDAVNLLVWDAPVYERLFATVRSVNTRRPPGSRLRVVLADPPIEWSSISVSRPDRIAHDVGALAGDLS